MNTGFNDEQDWLRNPGLMIVLHINPATERLIQKLVRENQSDKNNIISGLINAAYNNSSTDIAEALNEYDSYSVYCSYFENTGMAIILSVFNSRIVALLVLTEEAERIEGALEKGINFIDLGWIQVTIGEIKTSSLFSGNSFSVN